MTYDEISDKRSGGPTSAEVGEVVQEARDRQRARYQGRFVCNAHLDSKAVRQHGAMNGRAEKLLQSTLDHMGLSARAFDKVLRLSRNIADLAATEEIAEKHVVEAVQYRSLDRELLAV